MNKKGKLHTLSKYEADRLNHIAFMPKEDKNLFSYAGPLNNLSSNILSGYNTSGVGQNVFNSTPAMQQAMNSVFPTPVLQDYTATPFQRVDIGPKVDRAGGTNLYKGLSIKDTTIAPITSNSSKSKSFGNTMAQIGGVAAQVAPRELFDTFDPVYHLAGGRESTIGNGLSETGVGLFKAGAQSGNGALMLAGAGAKVLGGLWNGAFGAKWNKENIADIENNIAQMRATDLSSVNSNAALLDAWGRVNLGYDFDQDYIGKNGWLNHKATRKFNKLNAFQEAARAYVKHQLTNAAEQADETQDSLARRRFTYSDGGFLDNVLNGDNMGSGIQYSFISDYLNTKKQDSDTKAKMANMYAGTPGTFFGGVSDNVFASGGKIHINPKNKGKFNALKKRTGKTTEELTHSKNPLTRKRAIFAQNARKWKHADGGLLDLAYEDALYAFGGDMQTNGADFSTGLSHINAGLSHELNPNEGVQVGVDSEGVPNLVEEGEVIWNDYVFSNRIGLDDTTKDAFHINKKKDITYADLAKKLEKEIKERPNDPISKAAFNAQMERLTEEQERQKAEMEAQKAQEAFEALSPEEQVAVMQQAAQQEQAAQEAAMQQQVMAEQQVSPEEAAMMQQQIAEQQMAQPQVIEPQAAEQEIMACGGHKYDKGGELKKAIYKLIGKNTDSEYKQWLKDNHIEDVEDAEDWENILKNEAVVKAIAKTNPAVAHAISNGYDFGSYNPSDIEKATIQSISKGNWKQTNGSGWLNSTDLAFQQAVNGLTEDQIKKLSTEELADLMRKTDAYKNTSKWLENSDNALLYLNTLLNDDETPEVAKQYARKFVTDGKWKDGFNYDYATVFGSNGKGVRETNPGTYWHSVVEANRGNEAKNFVVNEDGTIEEIVGDVPTNWTSDGSYSWANPENNILYNYFRRPVTESKKSETPVKTNTEEAVEEAAKKVKYAPILKDETNIGLFGPAAALAMQAMGIGKPDYTELDKAKAIMDRPVKLATYQPVPGYLTYKPADIWAAEIANNASARASDRAILNANPMTANAALVANNYNNQIANSELFRNAMEYNDNQRKMIADFNRGTNIQNANAFNQLSQFNAVQANADKQRRAYLAANIAGEKMDADASWYNSLYGNVGTMFKGIGDYEREVRDRNTVAKMIASGIYPGVNPENAVYSGFVKPIYVAEGGKVKRRKNKKRGLTI